MFVTAGGRLRRTRWHHPRSNKRPARRCHGRSRSANLRRVERGLRGKGPRVLAGRVREVGRHPALVEGGNLRVPNHSSDLHRHRSRRGMATSNASNAPLLLTLLLFFNRADRVTQHSVTSARTVPRATCQINAPQIKGRQKTFYF